MAVSLRQSGAPASTFGTTATLTLGSAAVVGSTLVVVVEHQATGTLTVTDNGSNTWTKRVASENSTSGSGAAVTQYKIDIWTAPVTTACTTITLTDTASSTLGGTWYEVAGGGSVRATATTYVNTPSTSPTPLPLAFSAGDFVVGAVSYYNASQSNTVASPFTITGTGSGTSTTRYASAQQVATSSGTTGPAWTLAGSSNAWAQVALALAPSAPSYSMTGSSTGNASNTATFTPALTAAGSSLGLASDTNSTTPHMTATAASTGTSSETAGITTTEQMTGFSTGTASETAIIRPTIALSGSSMGVATDAAQITAIALPLTASSVGTSSETAADVRTEAHIADGSSVGTASDVATMTTHVALTGASVGSSSEQSHIAPTEALTGLTTGTSSETSTVSYTITMTGAEVGTASDVATASIGYSMTGESTGTASDVATAVAFLTATATADEYGYATDVAIIDSPSYTLQAAEYGMATDSARARFNFTSALIAVEFLAARWTMQVGDSRWKADTGRNRWELL
jgi:hypothetical protein